VLEVEKHFNRMPEFHDIWCHDLYASREALKKYKRVDFRAFHDLVTLQPFAEALEIFDDP